MSEGPVRSIRTPIALDYRYTPGLATSRFLRAVAEGRQERLWEILGAHPRSFTTADGVVNGVSFAVWAPNAKGVSLIGEFNHWDGDEAQLRVLGSTGVWELFWPDFPVGGLRLRDHQFAAQSLDRARRRLGVVDHFQRGQAGLSKSDHAVDHRVTDHGHLPGLLLLG